MLNLTAFAASGSPAVAALALAAWLVWPATAWAAPGDEAGADLREPAPALGSASAPLWRAPGLPAEDDWDDLDAAVKAETSAHPAPPRPVQPTRPGPREGVAAQTRGQPAEEPSAARQMAKSALAWVKEAMPWAFADDQPEAPPREIVVTGDMLLGSPHEVLAPGADHRVGGGVPAPAALPPPAARADGAPADARHIAWGTAGDPLQEAIALVREVARHPMTWLLIALVVLARLAVWLLARPARRARVHRRRRRRHHR